MKRTFFLWIILFIPILGYPQEWTDTTILRAGSTSRSVQSPHIIPPSSNASALGIYADIPVSKYTGIPEINIPLYEIQNGNINLPINLQYHSSGIKASQESSWIGLGWSLNAGGVITRSIRGWDDFGNSSGDIKIKGYMESEALPPCNSDNKVDINSPDYNYNVLKSKVTQYLGIIRNSEDSEPDLFYYNFCGYSGKMVFRKQQGPDYEAQLLNQEPIKIRYLSTKENWEVTTPDGCVYYFGTKESSTNYVEPYITETPMNTNTKQRVVVNSWYLDSIVYQHDIVKLSYNKGATIKSQPSFYYTTGDVYESGPVPLPYWHISSYSSFQQSYSEILLQKISFRGGSVSFSTTDRSDLLYETFNGSRPQQLSGIQIMNDLGIEVYGYSFHTSYFGSNTNPLNSRLRLDKVISSAGETYAFQYFSNSLDSKNTLAVDHWGNFNGAYGNNNRCSPHIASPSFYIENRSINISANREAKEYSAKSGILTRIDYPTGGYRTFEYELNDFDSLYTLAKTHGFYSIFEERNSSAFEEGGNDTIRNIVINKDVPVYLDISITLSNCSCNGQYLELPDGVPLVMRYKSLCEIQKKRENGMWNTVRKFTFDTIECKDVDSSRGSLNYHINLNHLILPAGEYRIVNNSYDFTRNVVTFIYPRNRSKQKCKGGGLRIANIKHFDGKKVMTTFYNYTMKRGNETISSGVLITIPSYVYTNGSAINIRTTESIIPMGNSAAGNIVGYSQVTEYCKNENSLSSGKSVYTFKNYPEFRNYSMRNLPGEPNLASNENGLPIKVEYWDSLGNLKEKTEYTYLNAFNLRKNVKGFKVYSLQPPSNEVSCLFSFYDNYADWCYLAGKNITQYTESGDSITKSYEYYYDNTTYKQISRKTSYENDIIHTIYKYPYDFEDFISRDMTYRHMIAPVIEQTILKNQEPISGSYVHYGYNDKSIPYPDLIVPISIENWTKDKSFIRTQVQCTKYDMYANPVFITKDRQSHSVYIWSYRGKHPIAEILNATYSEVQNALNVAPESYSSIPTPDASMIDDLWNRLTSKLPEALVTTYVYRPLVGVVAITYPNGVKSYYEYDSKGRLQTISDNEKHVLKKYEYNYNQK